MLAKLHRWALRKIKELLEDQKKKTKKSKSGKQGLKAFLALGAFANTLNVVLECNGLPKHKI